MKSSHFFLQHVILNINSTLIHISLDFKTRAPIHFAVKQCAKCALQMCISAVLGKACCPTGCLSLKWCSRHPSSLSALFIHYWWHAGLTPDLSPQYHSFPVAIRTGYCLLVRGSVRNCVDFLSVVHSLSLSLSLPPSFFLSPFHSFCLSPFPLSSILFLFLSCSLSLFVSSIMSLSLSLSCLPPALILARSLGVL